MWHSRQLARLEIIESAQGNKPARMPTSQALPLLEGGYHNITVACSSRDLDSENIIDGGKVQYGPNLQALGQKVS